MDTYIFNALNKYFKTLSKKGSINRQESLNAFVVSVAYSIYNDFFSRVTKEDAVIFNKYIDCHTKDSCLFNGSAPYLRYNSDPTSSLITIVDNDIISTLGGSIMVATNNQTQKFTDFEIRPNVESDNYLVGYDASDNREISVNVNNIGIFWE